MTWQIVVMGVSGTGKSAVGNRIADQMGMTYVEGDEHHPQANIEKMSQGHPLNDEDRRPWLEELAGLLATNEAAGVSSVMGCSALRRSYRDILRSELPDHQVTFVHLEAGFDVLRERMVTREHFMPSSLLQSQLDTLEPLQEDEDGEVIDVDAPLDEVVETVVRRLKARSRSLE